MTTATCAFAQTVTAPDLGPDPAAIMLEHLKRMESAQPRKQVPVTEAPPILRGIPPSTVVTIAVSEILFSKTTLLSQSELSEVGQRYVGKSLAAADIQRLLDDVSELYRSKGVLTAVPVLPKQNLNSGVLKVLLVEGKLGKVQVRNAGKMNSEWVKQWFDLQEGTVVSNEELREKLTRFNTSSDLTATADFVPGARFGISDLAVTIQDAPRLQSWAMFEVSQTAQSAPAQLSVGMRLAPFSPVGGRADTAFLVAPNSRTIMASASIPDGFSGWRVGVTGSISENRSTISSETDAPDLSVAGRSAAVSLDFGRAWVLRSPWTLGTNVSLGTVRSSTRVDQVELLNRKTDRYTLTGSLHYDGDRTQAALRAGLIMGREGTLRYNYADIGGSLTKSLDKPSQWRTRLNGALRVRGHGTPSASDRFQIGGTESVRGYDPAIISGDAGAAIQMELRYRPASSSLSSMEGYVFLDAGSASSRGSTEQIRSTGLGLQARISPYLGLELLGSHQLVSKQGPRNRLSLRTTLGW